MLVCARGKKTKDLKTNTSDDSGQSKVTQGSFFDSKSGNSGYDLLLVPVFVTKLGLPHTQGAQGI